MCAPVGEVRHEKHVVGPSGGEMTLIDVESSSEYIENSVMKLSDESQRSRSDTICRV